LIPLLETQYNPNIREVLVRLAQNAREDEQALQQLAHAHTDRAMPVADSAGCLSFPIDVLLEAGPAVGKRIVKLLFARIGLDADIAAVHLSALWTALFAKKTGSTIEFPGGYTAKIAYEAVLFCSPDQHFSQHALAGKTLQIEALPAAQAPGPFDLPPYQAVLDADKVEESGGALSMRTRRPGDRIYPLGGPGSKKLQDYFVDAKVPKHERDGWPLVCIGSEVLWVSGKTVSERFKVAPDTKRVLLLEIVDEI